MLKVHSARWRVYAALANAPWLVILLYLGYELLERLLRLYDPPVPATGGTLPPHPSVLVQVLLGAEEGTAERAIDAACMLRWPQHRLEVRRRGARRAAAGNAGERRR
jgi:hypothetical protein